MHSPHTLYLTTAQLSRFYSYNDRVRLVQLIRIEPTEHVDCYRVTIDCDPKTLTLIHML